MTLSADEEVDPELDDMTRRFWICLVLTIPLLLLSMAEMVPGLPFPRFLTGPSLVWIQFRPGGSRCVVGRAAVFRTGLVLGYQP